MPNTRHSSRGVHLAMASTFCMPSTSSIRASRPMRRLSFSFFSSWCSSLSANSTSAGVMTLVIMMVSRCSPAPSTTSMMSSKAYSVVRSLMRTQRVLPVQLSVFSACDDLLAGVALLARRDGVLEIEEDMVGLRFGGLLHHLLARAGRRKLDAAGAAGTVGHAFSFRQRSCGAQAGDLAAAAADGFQILVGMLAQQRRAMAHLAGRLGHLDRDAGDLDLVVEAGMRAPTAACRAPRNAGRRRCRARCRPARTAPCRRNASAVPAWCAAA